MAIAGIFLTEYSGVAFLMSLITLVSILMLSVISYRVKLKTEYSKSRTSHQTEILYDNICEDSTPEFNVLILPNGTKISHSEPLNAELLNNKKISVIKTKNHEKPS